MLRGQFEDNLPGRNCMGPGRILCRNQSDLTVHSQSLQQTPLQWEIAALVTTLNVVAIEAFITDLHPGPQRAHGRKFLDREPDRLRCCRKATIA
jgi:hypothetical protein